MECRNPNGEGTSPSNISNLVYLIYPSALGSKISHFSLKARKFYVSIPPFSFLDAESNYSRMTAINRFRKIIEKMIWNEIIYIYDHVLPHPIKPYVINSSYESIL